MIFLKSSDGDHLDSNFNDINGAVQVEKDGSFQLRGCGYSDENSGTSGDTANFKLYLFIRHYCQTSGSDPNLDKIVLDVKGDDYDVGRILLGRDSPSSSTALAAHDQIPKSSATNPSTTEQTTNQPSSAKQHPAQPQTAKVRPSTNTWMASCVDGVCNTCPPAEPCDETC
ncbi:unnamed protein product [Soboliphyme baturini]|uniref:ZP domain-containing protein n=1 Tax=Soboliphyme baturini TaxID=241478 RepID=A0A183J5S2_9BILA|nr:unnamed protein product [Soboliphyme baturini]